MKLANWAKVIRHWIWVAPLALGVVFVASGVYMMTKGQNAKNEVRDAIVAENMAGTAHQEVGACEPVRPGHQIRELVTVLRTGEQQRQVHLVLSRAERYLADQVGQSLPPIGTLGQGRARPHVASPLWFEMRWRLAVLLNETHRAIVNQAVPVSVY